MFEVKKEKFSEKEVKVLDFWKKNKIFEKSVSLNENKTLFSFYDGPPFATGLPHYGHLVASILKDVVPRYKTMKGFFVPRRFGWDCHGLPVEYEIEKALNLKGRSEIEAYGLSKFNEACENIVLRYANEWIDIVERIGRWVDFKRQYKTMDFKFMESIMWAMALGVMFITTIKLFRIRLKF